MEVRVSRCRGLEGDAFLSVSAGHVSRQVPVVSGQVLQFPLLPASAEFLKLDLLKHVGSCKLSVSSANDMYSVLFPAVGKELAGPSVEVEVREVPQLCSESSAEASALSADELAAKDSQTEAVTDDHAYLHRFGIHNVLKQTLHEVVREKPEDPYNFMAAYLARVANNGSGGGGSCSLQGGGAISSGGARCGGNFGGMEPEVMAAPYQERTLQFMEDAALDHLHQYNARLSAENAHLYEEIARFRRLCEETLPSNHQGSTFSNAGVPADKVAMVGPAAAALEEALRGQHSRGGGDACAEVASSTAKSEDFNQVVASLCQTFSDLAVRLTHAVKTTQQLAEISGGKEQTFVGAEEAAAAAINSALEAETSAIRRRIAELESQAVVR
eukprot:TRINITY_DN10009_c1_g1_i2.p1 TRINITY_DN10009_c1_g1~~TRINITY_DN10009_c1_g1_i2.p1  ORF type:complete len:397 (+),score=76.42 TRINITY_DN10009_c1_g1_i2:39-1193(+)